MFFTVAHDQTSILKNSHIIKNIFVIPLNSGDTLLNSYSPLIPIFRLFGTTGTREGKESSLEKSLLIIERETMVSNLHSLQIKICRFDTFILQFWGTSLRNSPLLP
jgi:hypothetical protein